MNGTASFGLGVAIVAFVLVLNLGLAAWMAVLKWVDRRAVIREARRDVDSAQRRE